MVCRLAFNLWLFNGSWFMFFWKSCFYLLIIFMLFTHDCAWSSRKEILFCWCIRTDQGVSSIPLPWALGALYFTYADEGILLDDSLGLWLFEQSSMSADSLPKIIKVHVDFSDQMQALIHLDCVVLVVEFLLEIFISVDISDQRVLELRKPLNCTLGSSLIPWLLLLLFKSGARMYATTLFLIPGYAFILGLMTTSL